jgi:hypothetical protein
LHFTVESWPLDKNPGHSPTPASVGLGWPAVLVCLVLRVLGTGTFQHPSTETRLQYVPPPTRSHWHCLSQRRVPVCERVPVKIQPANSGLKLTLMKPCLSTVAMSY